LQKKLQYFLDKRTKAANENLITECVDAHINFYISLAEASKNDVLADLYKLFAAQLKGDLLNTHKDTSFFKDAPDNHHKLLDSVLREDPRKAWYWSAKITGHITQ